MSTRNKAYLKYAGGKSRIIENVLQSLPENINRFVEPFVGSGTVALNVSSKSKLLNDFNRDLIQSHLHCINNPQPLIQELSHLYVAGREAYYDLRTEFNQTRAEDTLRRSAIFIYMNKHGFNGMVRYNRDGLFNIPVGKSKTIHFPYDEILTFSKFLGENTEFTCTDFRETFKRVSSGDVVYVDSPYVPASATNSDIHYTADGFSKKDHEELSVLVKDAYNKGAYVVVSNHDTEITRNLYSDATEMLQVKAFRSISRNGDERGKVPEILAIYNPFD